MSKDNQVVWRPSKAFKENANLTDYKNWLRATKNLEFKSYSDLWEWSVKESVIFWQSIADYFKVIFHQSPNQIRTDDPMPYTRWFEGATLNYAEHVFRNKTHKYPAIYFASERRQLDAVSWEELERRTACLQTFLKKEGIEKGDRVVAFLPNIPEATVSFLAVNSLGAIWSSCSPDFGAESVLDRFKQIAPKIFITVDGYTYNGKPYNRLEVVRQIRQELPSVEKVITIPYLNQEERFETIRDAVLWEDIMTLESGELTFIPVPFSHPIWILYSSGTTGPPKAITHSHGGMLLEHLKYLSLHNDVHSGENFFWYSTTGWMMWNFVQASLLVGASIVLYDGAAGYPDLLHLWRLTAELPIHHFGTSAPYLIACMKNGLHPSKDLDLSALRSIGSTGSPLPPEGFDYVYQHIKKEVWLCSMSGGTDICTAWVGGNPHKPVIKGEIQSRALGCAMYSWDEEGNALENEVGEMVVTQSMPCMPIYFWKDEDYKRYESSYFDYYPGVWRHGDWLKITPNGGVVILGRSDTTLNRQGIRIGTAEVYQAMNKIQSITDSLIVNIELPNGEDYMPLFVVMKEKEELTDEIKAQIRRHLRTEFSPRHVPDEIIAVADLPYTISGKKMEAAVKKILKGVTVDKAVKKGAMRNPQALATFVNLAKKIDF